MISRSPTWTKVTLSLPIAVRSTLTGPSKWMVTAWPVCGLLTLTVDGNALPPATMPAACATLLDESMNCRRPLHVYLFLIITQGQPRKRKGVNSTQAVPNMELLRAFRVELGPGIGAAWTRKRT